MADDKLVKLLFLDKNCHAEVLHLGECWQNIIRNQHLPVPVAHMLGELTCAALMLAVNLKFKGPSYCRSRGTARCGLRSLKSVMGSRCARPPR